MICSNVNLEIVQTDGNSPTMADFRLTNMMSLNLGRDTPVQFL